MLVSRSLVKRHVNDNLVNIGVKNHQHYDLLVTAGSLDYNYNNIYIYMTMEMPYEVELDWQKYDDTNKGLTNKLTN